LIEGSEQLKSYIRNYYNSLFGEPEEGNFSMDESQTSDIPQVSVEENNLLTAAYSEEGKYRRHFSKWDTTKPLVLMGSLPSFIKLFGIVSSWTFLSCSPFSMLDN
jgi:hypothetical protein